MKKKTKQRQFDHQILFTQYKFKIKRNFLKQILAIKIRAWFVNDITHLKLLKASKNRRILL